MPGWVGGEIYLRVLLQCLGVHQSNGPGPLAPGQGSSQGVRSPAVSVGSAWGMRELPQCCDSYRAAELDHPEADMLSQLPAVACATQRTWRKWDAVALIQPNEEDMVASRKEQCMLRMGSCAYMQPGSKPLSSGIIHQTHEGLHEPCKTGKYLASFLLSFGRDDKDCA